MTSRGFASSYRVVLLAGVVLAALLAIGTRLVFLHVIDREKLVAHVEEARRSVAVSEARRGDILDARGDILATSRSQVTVGLDAWAMRAEDRTFLPHIAALLDLPLTTLEQAATPATRLVPVDPTQPDGEKREQKIRWVKLAEAVDESVAAQLEALEISKSNRVRGLTTDRTYTRAYPHHELASQLVGYVNKAGDPGMGIEAYMDFYLRGQNGWRETEKDGARRELAQFRSREVPALDGFSVKLSLDLVVQHLVERELAAIVEKFRPAKATIIVSNPHTGFILGLGNYPSFDLNAFNTAPLVAQKNMAVTDQLEPGSTFKIVAIAAALEEGLITPQTMFDLSLDTIDYRGRTRRFMRDDHPANGPRPVSFIIAQSSNIGTAQVAMRLGDEKFYAALRAFGFGETSGFPFGGEIPGMIAPPAKWTTPDITRIPSGYSIAATPLQIHYAMSTVASGGELMLPQVISEVRDAGGEIVYRYGPQVRRRVLSERNATEMARMLQRVVSKEGTAMNAFIPGFEVAGKTGTAQKIIDGRYSTKHHFGSFTGFFPASDPRVAITVIVDDGRRPDGGAGYGSQVAAPSFKRIGEQLIQHLAIKPPAGALPTGVTPPLVAFDVLRR